MDGTIEVTDTAVAPAQSGQDTQTSAPAQTSTDTAASAGTEGQQQAGAGVVADLGLGW